MTDDTINPHHAGQPPKTSTGTITLTFGLVQLPCKVYSGLNDPCTPKRSSYTEAGHPAGKMDYDKETGEPYKGTIVKRASSSDGVEVDLSDDEIAQVTGTRDGSAPIEAFVPLAAFSDGTYVIENLQQVRPTTMKAGTKTVLNGASAKGLRMLLDYLAERQVAALIRVVPARSYARWAAVLPDGRLATLAFAEQVRPAMAMPDVVLDPREQKMATMLFDTIEVSTPPLVNEVGAAIQAYVDAKAGGTVQKVEPVVMAESIDLMAALEASVAAAKAPVTTASLVPADWVAA